MHHNQNNYKKTVKFMHIHRRKMIPHLVDIELFHSFHLFIKLLTFQKFRS